MSRNEPYQPDAIAAQSVDARAQFITRTYTHLFGAIVGFTMIETVLFKMGVPQRMFEQGIGQTTWFVMFGAFILGGWMARAAAHRAKTLFVQYLALVGYVCLWAGMFLPLLYFAQSQPGAIESAAFVTLGLFAGLTAIAFFSRKDFSFLRTILMWGGLCAMAAIIAGMVFGFTLGPVFMVAMVALAGGSILYDTSNIIHHYNERQYVGAALELFASVALMFWYILQLFMSRD